MAAPLWRARVPRRHVARSVAHGIAQLPGGVRPGMIHGARRNDGELYDHGKG